MHLYNRIVTVLFFVVLFVCTTPIVFAQENQGVSALTPEVLALMEKADKIIAATKTDIASADRWLAHSAQRLDEAISAKASLITFLKAQSVYNAAMLNALQARGGGSTATHRAAMAYYDSVLAIQKTGKKVTEDRHYGEWQKKALTAIQPPKLDKELMERAHVVSDTQLQQMEESTKALQKEMQRLTLPLPNE